MKDILLVIAGGMIGWYLALNKEKETRTALTQVNKQVSDLSKQLVEEIEKNKTLNSIIEEETVETNA